MEPLVGFVPTTCSLRIGYPKRNPLQLQGYFSAKYAMFGIFSTNGGNGGTFGPMENQ
jgi:hypothetical protein